MATAPTTTRNIPSAPSAPSPRAMSAREVKVPKDKEYTRKSVETLQRERAQDLHDKDPANNPAPQVGMSSSQLNTAYPGMKEQATEEAKNLPSNNEDPDKGVSEKKAEQASEKFAGAVDPNKNKDDKK